MQKNVKNSPSGHHRTTLSGYIFATKARIDNREKMLNSNAGSTHPHNMANFSPLTTDRFTSLCHPGKFQQVSRLGSITARHSISGSGRQRNFVAVNRGHHLYSAGRPSCWTLAHILVCKYIKLGIKHEQNRVHGLSFS